MNLRSRLGFFALATAALVLVAGLVPASAAGTATYVGTTGGTGVSPIAVDSSGRLITADAGVIKIYSSPTNLSSPTTCSVTFPAGQTEAKGIALKSNGDVYLSFGNGEVKGYSNPLTACVAAPIVAIAAGDDPMGMAFDAADHLWVACISGGVVREYSATSLVGTHSVAGGPDAVAMDGNGHVFVTTSFTGQLFKADVSGTVAFVDTGFTGMFTPVGVTAQANGLVQVANNAGDRVVEFDTNASGTTPINSVDVSSLTSGMGVLSLAGPVGGSFFVGLYFGGIIQVSGIGIVPSVAVDPLQVPAPILQQLPANTDGSCTALADQSVSYGTGLAGGWHGAWAQWANAGKGGPVCSRTLTFSPFFNRWTITA